MNKMSNVKKRDAPESKVRTRLCIQQNLHPAPVLLGELCSVWGEGEGSSGEGRDEGYVVANFLFTTKEGAL